MAIYSSYFMERTVAGELGGCRHNNGVQYTAAGAIVPAGAYRQNQLIPGRTYWKLYKSFVLQLYP